MKPVFENRYVSTHKMMAEFGRKYAVGPRMPVVLVCWAVYAGFFLFCVHAEILSEMLPMLLTMGVLFLAFFFMPHFYALGGAGNPKKKTDTAPEVVIIFGETIELHEDLMRINIDYRRIERVVHLKYSYVLMLGRRNGILLDPKGFTKGNFRQFKRFLREKRPDLTIPD